VSVNVFVRFECTARGKIAGNPSPYSRDVRAVLCVRRRRIKRVTIKKRIIYETTVANASRIFYTIRATGVSTYVNEVRKRALIRYVPRRRVVAL